MYSLSVQALSGHVYTIPITESTTVRDVKNQIREVDEDWKGLDITPSTAATRRATQSIIPQFHHMDEPSTNIQPGERGEGETGEMETIQEEDPSSEMDTLLTPDGDVMSDSDPILKHNEGLKKRTSFFMTKTMDQPTVLYRLKTYPSYSDYLQVQLKYWQADKGWRGLLVNFILITLAAFFLSAMAQCSFNLPKSWQNYLKLTKPIPITFQTFAVLLSATLLGKYRSTLSVVMYLCMIVVGAPFGATQSGGNKILYGATAGYLYSYLFASFLVGWLAERGWDRRYRTILLSMFLGNVVIYIFGLIYMPFGRSVQDPLHRNPHDIYCGSARGCVGQVFYDGLIPFIPGDLIKIGMASAILPIGWKLLGWKASQKKSYVHQQQPAIQPQSTDEGIEITTME